MNIAWILLTFLYFGICRNFVDSAQWIDDLTRYIVEDSGARQVKLTTNPAIDEKFANPRIDEIFAKLMEKMPIFRLSINEDSNVAKNPSHENGLEDDIPMDTTATFFLHVHESRESLTIPPSYRLIDELSRISAYQYSPRYMILFIVRESFESLEKFLHRAWTKSILDMTIIELVEPEVAKNFTIQDDPSIEPLLHRLNPFRNEYTRIKWTSDVSWFPDKADDMRLHPLRIQLVDMPPFSIIQRDRYGNPTVTNGANNILTRIISRHLNSTLRYFDSPYNLRAMARQGIRFDPVMLFRLGIEKQKIDLVANLAPHYANNRRETILRTTMIVMEELCPVVPILPEVEIPHSSHFFRAHLFTIVIVITFGLFRQIFRFRASTWKLYYIFRVLFGIPVTRQPEVAVERVVFAALLLVSSISSSAIWSTITDVSLRMDGEMKFETLEELDRSGLIPIMTPFATKTTFVDSDRFSLNLRKKSIWAHKPMYDCAFLASCEKNITCIMYKREAMIAVHKSMRDGRKTIKIGRPCFWWDSMSFLVSRSSPYRAKFDSIILRMKSSGLIDKLYEDADIVSSKVHQNHEISDNSDTESTITLRQQLLTITIVGYTLSILAFIIEIVVDRFLKHVVTFAIALRQRPMAIMIIGCSLSSLVLVAEILFHRIWKLRKSN